MSFLILFSEAIEIFIIAYENLIWNDSLIFPINEYY